MTLDDALAFVERHGVVLEAARHHTVPSIAAVIAGEPLRGSWWAHPRGREIFAITRALRVAPQLLVCRLVDDKITFVHERCWPALVRLAERFPATALARLREVHARDGRHRVETTSFPLWVPIATTAAAGHLTQAEAIATLGVPLSLPGTSA